MDRRTPWLLLIACLCIASGLAAQAQSRAPAAPVHACDLATNADVEKVTGRSSQEPPSPLSTVQKTESACDFWEAAIQLGLFSRRLSQDYLNSVLDAYGFGRTRQAVAGVGDSASIYFTPKGKASESLLVTYTGDRTVTVRVRMDSGQPAESAQPYAVGLAKIALAKLR